jgi:hypothetical protein
LLILMSVGDPRAYARRTLAAGLNEVFTHILQAGRVDVGFQRAQVDRFGNINSTSIGIDPCHPEVRSLAAAVLAISPAWHRPSSSPSTSGGVSRSELITLRALAGWMVATAEPRPD